jgi:hypothetical protein
MEKLDFILMADIIKSRVSPQNMLMEDFKHVVGSVNISNREKLLSPLTITLGDEFQGIVRDLKSAIQIILQLEEKIIEEKANFKLRYVLLEGKIETEINRNIAHEMLGSGLTEARYQLMNIKNSKERFHFSLKNQKQSDVFKDVFIVYQGIVDDWNLEKDYVLVNAFLKWQDYKTVAEKLDKSRSLMWKRERSQKIKEYLSLKNIITFLTITNYV